MRRLYPLFSVFSDSPAPDGGAGGGAGAPAPSPASAPAPSPAPAPGAAAGSPPAPSAGTPGAPPPGTPPEDRSNWYPPDAYSAAQRAAHAANYRAQMLTRMLEAAHGFRMPAQPSPEEERREQVRGYLQQVYPELGQLAKLAELMPNIERLLQSAPQMEEAYSQLWERAGHQTLNTLYTAVAKELQTEPDKLDPEYMADLGESFMRWLKTDQARMSRYYRGDQKIADEFVTAWKARHFDPIRRLTQAPDAGAATRNAGLPRAPQSSAPVPPQPPQAPQTEDEVHDAAWRNFQAQVAGSRP